MYLHQNLWDGCVGAWCPSQGASGYLLRDHSPYRNHGTLTNMDPGTDWVASDGKPALDLITDDYVAIRNNLRIDSGTITAWLYTRSTDIGGQFAVSHYLGGNRLYLQNRLVSGTYYVTCGFGSSQYLITGACDANTWVHAATTWNGATAELFVNGVLVGSAAYSGLSAFDSVLNIGRVNAAGGIGYWDGLLDDLRGYNRVLPAENVKTLALRRGIAYELRRAVRGWTGSGGSPTIAGSVSATLADVTATSSAESTISAGVTSTLDAVTATSSATSPISAGITATLDAVTATSSAESTISAGVTSTLDAVTATSSAESTISAGVTATLADVTATSSAESTISAGVTSTLDDVTAISSGTVVTPGGLTLTVTLDDVTATSAAESTISAGITATLDAVSSVSSATSLIAAGVTTTLDDVLLVAIGGEASFVPTSYYYELLMVQ